MDTVFLFFDLLAQYNLKKKYSSLQNNGISVLFFSYVLCAIFLYNNPEYRLFIFILFCLLPIIISTCIFLFFLKEFHKKLDKNDRKNFLNSFFPFKFELVLSGNTSRYTGISILYLTNILWIIVFYGVWIGRINFDHFFIFFIFILIFSLMILISTFFILLHFYYSILTLTRR